MRTKIMLGAILLCLLPAVASAQNQHDALVQEVYIKSGMAKELEQLPLVIKAAVDQAAREDDSLKNLPKNISTIMSALAQEAFAGEKLKEVVLPALREKLTVQDLEKILEWLDSPLGKICTQLEVAAATPEAVIAMEQYGSQIKKTPPTAARLDNLRKLDLASKGTETNVEVAFAGQVAVFLAVNYTLPVEQQVPLNVIERELEKTRPQIEAEVRKETLISLLYAYRSLTDAQIKQYIKFLKSPVGSKYVAVCNEALKKALWEGNIRWGKAIGEALKQEEKKSDA